LRKSIQDISCPIIRRIALGVDHKTIKEAFGLTDAQFQAKLDEINPPTKKVAKKKAAKKKVS